ncbi:MAG: transporter substrate-binding domain-containing protein [Thermodesulfobacteriota bacterium]
MSSVERRDFRERLLFLLTAALLAVIALCPGKIAAGIRDPADPSPVASASEIDYPPFCFVDSEGRATGFSIELLRAALAAMGKDVTFRTGTWEDVRGWLEHGEVQALPLVGRTPEREHLFDFTFPYMSLHGAIVVRKGTQGVWSLSDLKGKNVAVMKGDNAEEFLRREDRGFAIHTTLTFKDALRELSEGRYDAVIIQRLVALRLIQESGLTNLSVVENPIQGFQQDFCFAVKEGDRDTLAFLNEGLALVMADGTYRHLHSKWFAALELPTRHRIVVGGDYNFPPFEYLDANGRPAGYNVDLTRAIAQEMGLEIEIQLGPWSEILQQLARGEIDVIQGMFYSPERDHSFDFTPPHMANHCVSVVRKGAGAPPSTPEQLKSLRIAVQEGDIMHDFAVKNGLKDRLSVVDSQEDALRDVVEGKQDCALVSRIAALYWINRNRWNNLVVGSRPLLSPEYCYAVEQNQKALLAQFAEGLKVLDESGEYRRIYQKWMGVYPEGGLSFTGVLRYFSLALAVLLIVLLGVFLWSWSLRRQVARKTLELRESADTFKYVFESANVGKSLTSPTGEINVNSAFAEMLGYSPEELKGKTWQEITPVEDIETSRKEIGLLLSGEKDSTRFQKRYLHKNGDMVWADASLSLRRGPGGEPLYFITTIVDINEQKRAEEALKSSEEKYRRLFESMSEGFALHEIITDEEGKPSDFRFLEMNPTCERMMGFARGEMIGRRMSEIMNEPGWIERYGRVAQTGQAENFEEYSAALDRWLEVFAYRPEPGQCAAVFNDITARRRAEEALRRSEENYRLLADQTLDAIWTMDMDLVFTYVNPSVTRLTGHSPEEWIGSRLQDHCDEENFHKMAGIAAEELAKGPSGSGVLFEAALLKKNGDPVPVEISGRALFDESGQPVKFQGVTRDNTERKLAEKKLHEERDKFAKIVATAPGAICMFRRRPDGSTYFPYASPSIGDLFGFSPQELAQDASIMRARIHPDDLERVAGEVADSQRLLASWQSELRYRHPEKEEIWLETRFIPSREDDGSTVWSGFVLDITGRKRAEEALRESEERYRSLLQMAPVGIAVQQDGRIVFANPAGLRLLGAGSHEEIIGKPIEEIIHPDWLQEAKARIQGLLTGDAGLYSAESRYVRLDGRVIDVVVMASPLVFNGKPAVQVIASDITERKKAEQEQEELHAQLAQAQKIESVGRLAGGVAHDYNNMLSVIIGYAEMALEKTSPTDTLHKDLKEIIRAGTRSMEITRQLLAFARKQTVSPKELVLNEALEGMLNMLRNLIGEDLELLWVPGKDLWPVSMDPVQLDQILANLCVNARDAITSNGRITIETRNIRFDEAFCRENPGFVPGDYVLLTVCDNGSGMDRETLDNIFEPFFTTKEQGKGTGLGLSTVYGIIKQNNGFIQVESEPGQGTTFKIYLPRHLAGGERHPEAGAAQPAVRGHETILLVEDEHSILRMAARMLEKLGYNVIPAATPGQAIRLAREHAGRIDLLMTDVVMPEMNGRELAKNLMSLYPGLKRLFMSGYTADVIAYHGVLDEGVNFIQKPFSMSNLAAKVRESLEG